MSAVAEERRVVGAVHAWPPLDSSDSGRTPLLPKSAPTSSSSTCISVAAGGFWLSRGGKRSSTGERRTSSDRKRDRGGPGSSARCREGSRLHCPVRLCTASPSPSVESDRHPRRGNPSWSVFIPAFPPVPTSCLEFALGPPSHSTVCTNATGHARAAVRSSRDLLSVLARRLLLSHLATVGAAFRSPADSRSSPCTQRRPWVSSL